MFCSAAAACICMQAATADDEQKVEKRSMIYPLIATGLKSAFCRNFRGQWLHEMTTVLELPDLMQKTWH